MLLLACGIRFQFLDFLALLEKLIEQHRVHRFVAHRVDVAVLIAHHEVRIYFSYLFGDQTKLRCVCVVTLVVERDWLERQDSFTGVVHWLNLFLEPARRTQRAQLAVAVDQHWYCRPAGCHATNAGDKGFDLRTADADRRRLAGKTNVTNIDVAIACGKRCPCTIAQRDVEVAGGVETERTTTNGRVSAADGVVQKCASTDGRVEVAGSVASERTITVGRVGIPIDVVNERISAVGRVGVAGGVAKER